MDSLHFTPLVDLVSLLRAAEMRADLDPAMVNLPGAWVTCEGFQATSLGGGMTLFGVVYFLSPDLDAQRALQNLADLYNQVVPSVFTPDGPVTIQAVQLPDTTTELPALRVPVNLFTTPTPEEE